MRLHAPSFLTSERDGEISVCSHDHPVKSVRDNTHNSRVTSHSICVLEVVGVAHGDYESEIDAFWSMSFAVSSVRGLAHLLDI